MKKKNSKKSGKDKLAAGAEKIRQAEKEAKSKKIEPVVIPASTRPLEDIVRERVTMLPHHVGIKIADDTPFEESLRIVDWAMSLHEHSGFMVGDAINFGQAKWGGKYEQAMIQTGRAYDTVRRYAEAARRIAAKDRQAALSFSQHIEILRIGDQTKVTNTLKEVAKQAERGKAPTVKELRYKVQELTPRKPKKTSKRATSGKGKKGKPRKEVKPYEPTPDENAALDMAEASLTEAAKTAKENGVAKITYKLDNKDKRRWLKLLQPFQEWYFTLEKVTGYD